MAAEVDGKTLDRARRFLDSTATQEAYDAMLSDDPEKARAILLANFAQQERDDEREECAKLAASLYKKGQIGIDIAAAIRGRKP